MRSAALKRCSLLLLAILALLAAAACGAPPARLRPDAATASQPQGRSLPEEFDPAVLGEDLLLIPPAGQAGSGALAALPASGQPPYDRPAHQGPDGTGAALSPATEWYQVQAIATSLAETSELCRAALEEQLGVPARVFARPGLHAVRVGACTSLAEAEALRSRIVELGPEYGDAFVVAARTEEGAATATEATWSIDSATAVPPLVQAFGWRVLLDKMHSYPAAEQVKQRAVEQLHRYDIDITFKPPWYNVELGHYQSEAAAQQDLEWLEERFPNALKVRGQIMVPAGE